ncbi:hypothetical protein Tco_0942291 [Tanacetum coccineum]
MMLCKLFKRKRTHDDIGIRVFDAFPIFSAFPKLHINPTFTPAIASKMPYFVAHVAFLGARAIVVKIVLGALGQRSPIRLPFACPHIVDLGGDILHLERVVAGGYDPKKHPGDYRIPSPGVLAVKPSSAVRRQCYTKSACMSLISRLIISNDSKRSLPFWPDSYSQSLEALLTQDGSRVHTHDHNGSEAPDESPDSILSSEPKPLEKHRPPPPPSILSPRESSYPP